MEKIQFGDGIERFQIKSIQPVALHVMRIIYSDEMPDEASYEEPMTLYTSDGIKETTLEGWSTVYYLDVDNLTVYLSDDESIYVEPEPEPEPEPVPEPEPTPEPEPYVPTVEEVQSYKISQMQSTCSSTIKKGIDVDGEHFTLDSEARLALIIREFQINDGAEEVDFYPDDSPSRYYTAEEMQNIINTANDFINGNQVYCNELVLWIKSLTDIEEIEAVYYGMDIPAEHRSEVLEKMLPVADDETGMLPQEGNDDEPDEGGGDDPDDDDDSNVGAGGELDVGDPADDIDPADDPEPGDGGDD